jgi:hypothetical protein
MARETRSGTKAVVVFIGVLAVSAILAYYLHFRPLADAVPTPDEVGPSPQEVQGSRPPLRRDQAA